MATLDLNGLEFSFEVPGYVYDPNRHSPPNRNKANPFQEKHPATFDVAQQIHQLTDTPLLPPETYSVLFQELAKDLRQHQFSLTETSKRVRDNCIANSAQVSRQHVNFVLVGLNKAKYKWKDNANTSPTDLAKAFAQNVYDLCLSARMEIDKEKLATLFKWIIPKASQASNELGGAQVVD